MNKEDCVFKLNINHIHGFNLHLHEVSLLGEKLNKYTHNYMHKQLRKIYEGKRKRDAIKKELSMLKEEVIRVKPMDFKTYEIKILIK